MENHNSCEKLVGLEAGLRTPESLATLATIKSAKKRSCKCRNGVFAFLGIAIIFVISYEVWQAVWGDRLLRNRDQMIMDLMSVSDSAEPILAEDLEKLRDMMKEMREKINQLELMTETPDVVQNKMVDTVDPPPSILESKPYEQVFGVNEDEVIQDHQDDEYDTAPVVTVRPSDEDMFLQSWSGSKYYGRESSEDSPSSDEEDQPSFTDNYGVVTNDTTVKENGNSGEDVSEDIPPVEYSWPYWDWNVLDVDYSRQSASAEDVANSMDRVVALNDTSTTVRPIIVPFPLTDYDYAYDESYEYNDYEEEKTTASTESGFEKEESSIESTSLVSDATEDTKKMEDSVTTESTVTPVPQLYVFRYEMNYDLAPFLDTLRSLPDTLSQSLGLGVTSNDEEETVKPETDQISEDSLNAAEVFSESERLDELLAELERQRTEMIEELNRLQKTILIPDADDVLDDEFQPHITETPSSDYVSSWSYISKRSAEVSPEFESPTARLTSKEFNHKISLIEQAIDNDNHMIENEVSRTSAPNKQRLQEKLNRFYAKMEAVSAHIDRLHEKYLRLNKLDDDYVSRELSSEENRNGLENETNE